MKQKEEETGIYYVPELIVDSILKGYSPTRDNIFNVISNKKRQEIIRFCSKKKHSITEIKNHIGLSYNPTWKHVDMLIRKNLVKATPTIEKAGAIVYIETITPGSFNKKFLKLNNLKNKPNTDDKSL